ncbi:unnamed protein product [Cylindrotheca closterium]|uniref:Uncharacterized protein n=1 Tax=Cylindrotheca closterium TaxID=2856 RepID=A0AAD2FNZ0_9STRA|nr:unnamed protein product [Cylindrotheca closterium]
MAFIARSSAYSIIDSPPTSSVSCDMNMEIDSTMSFKESKSIPTPACLKKLLENEAAKQAMFDLGVELVCNTSDKVYVISQDDYFGYESGGTYAELYNFCWEGSGGGFHIWNLGTGNHPVVFLGSEGERAKLGATVEDFLQVVCSLQPCIMDVIFGLPLAGGIEDETDMNKALATDMDVKETIRFVERTQRQSNEDNEDSQLEAAKIVLGTIGRPFLSIREAMEKVVTAHLSEPRFNPQPTDD